MDYVRTQSLTNRRTFTGSSVVGLVRLELTTSWSQTRRSSQLSHSPLFMIMILLSVCVIVDKLYFLVLDFVLVGAHLSRSCMLHSKSNQTDDEIL